MHNDVHISQSEVKVLMNINCIVLPMIKISLPESWEHIHTNLQVIGLFQKVLALLSLALQIPSQSANPIIPNSLNYKIDISLCYKSVGM